MAESLFQAFDPVSKSDYIEKIIKDLKGKDYNEALLWNVEDLRIEPFYHSEDLTNDQYLHQKVEDGRHWKIVQSVLVNDVQKANKEALEFLMHGSEAIEFDLNGQKLDAETTKNLTENILLDIADVSIRNYDPADFNCSNARIHIAEDVLTHALTSGSETEPLSVDGWKRQLKLTTAYNLTVRLDAYQNAGANSVQQLAIGLALLSEYLNSCDKNELAVITGIKAHIALGSTFFLEVAKLRAFRALVNVVATQFGIEVPVYIEASPTSINKSNLDAYNNMLRNTTECMAAVVGGASAVNISAHDFLSGDSENSQRWARNISHILRNESYFDKVDDPAAGSYFVESLTNTLAHNAWQIFLAIEAKGGFMSAVADGSIQEMIVSSANKLKKAFAEKEMVLVGVNKYQKEVAEYKSEGADDTRPDHFMSPLRLAGLLE